MRRMNGDVLEIYDNKENVLMTLEESVKGNVFDIKVNGEIRNEVAHEFEDEIMAALSVCKNIEIDMSKTTYIASLTLKSLLSIQQIIDTMDDTSLVFYNLSSQIKEIFEESGFIDIFCIEER